MDTHVRLCASRVQQLCASTLATCPARTSDNETAPTTLIAQMECWGRMQTAKPAWSVTGAPLVGFRLPMVVFLPCQHPCQLLEQVCPICCLLLRKGPLQPVHTLQWHVSTSYHAGHRQLLLWQWPPCLQASAIQLPDNF